MAITQAMCTSFKKELLEGTHNFKATGGNTFKLALYTSSATMSASTTAYSTGQEASGTNYTAGGAALTNVNPTSSGTTAFTDFADLTFGTATVTARGCMIYNLGFGYTCRYYRCRRHRWCWFFNCNRTSKCYRNGCCWYGSRWLFKY